MTCSQAGEHLHRTPPEGWGQLPQAVREHLEKCAPCRKVWDFLTRHDSSERVAPEVEAKIKSSVVGSLEAVRPLPGARLTAAFLLIYAALSGIFIAITGVGGALEMGAFRFAAILGVVGAVILLLSVTLSREMVPGSPRLLTPARLFLSLLAGAVPRRHRRLPLGRERHVPAPELDVLPNRVDVLVPRRGFD